MHARDAFWYEKTHAKEIAAEQAKHAKEEESHGGIHMPSQSWFPIITALGLLIGGLCFASHNAIDITLNSFFANLAQKYSGLNIALFSEPQAWGIIGAIGGGVILLLGVLGWAFEGPGGYHLHIHKDGTVTGGEGQDNH